MKLFFHLFKQFKNFFKYPLQYLRLLINDLQKDYFLNQKKEFGGPARTRTWDQYIMSVLL